MDYLSAKFGDCIVSVVSVFRVENEQTESQTHTE